MSNREVLNSTVYRTSDIVSIIDAGIKLGAGHWAAPSTTSSIKIRYINKLHNTGSTYNATTRNYDDGEVRYVKCPHHGWGNSDVEVGLIRPAKIKISALRLLAEAAIGTSDEMLAPNILKNHLVEALADKFGVDKDKFLIACKDLSVRQDDKPKDRKAYTLRNLVKRIESKKNAIESVEWDIKRHEDSITYSKDRLVELKEELPKLEKKVKDFK